MAFTMGGSGAQYDYGHAATQAKYAEASAQRSRASTAAGQLNLQFMQWKAEQARLREEWGMSRQSMAQMVKEYNRAYGLAATGEESRYQEMRDITEATTGQRAADIRAEGFGEQANIMQRLARQGMSGTTIAPTMREGVRRGTSEKLNRLADMMQRTKLGIIERRDPRYPQPEAITSMAQLMGRGGTATRAAAPLAGMRQF